MPRIRSIHPEALESEKLLRLSDGAERTLWRLTTYTDDAGRGVDSPKLLASRLYPLDDDKDAEVVEGHLVELVEVGMLLRYSVAGKRYYEIHDFEDWQKPRHKTETKFPAPSDATATDTPPRPTGVGHTSDVRPDPPHGVVVGDGVGDGGGAAEDPPHTPAPPSTKAKAAPKRRRAQDWRPNDSHRAKARGLGLDVAYEAESFMILHDSKGNLFADWDQAFHMWLRNALKFGGGVRSLRAVADYGGRDPDEAMKVRFTGEMPA